MLQFQWSGVEISSTNTLTLIEMAVLILRFPSVCFAESRLSKEERSATVELSLGLWMSTTSGTTRRAVVRSTEDVLLYSTVINQCLVLQA